MRVNLAVQKNYPFALFQKSEKLLLLDIDRSIISQEELNIMTNCAYCKKKIIVKLVLTILNLKPSKLARDLHLSNSLVSKYIAGERKSHDLDIYFIEQIFEIKVKDYVRTSNFGKPADLDSSRQSV